MSLFHRRSPQEVRELKIANKIGKAKTVGQICAVFGYTQEEHVVTTEDGYVLTLHRIISKDTMDAKAPSSKQKPVVYLQHGLLTNSELFVCVNDASRGLPFVLVDHGYDVWLGNNRGNKYSRTHIKKKAKSEEFWDFSINDFARYDIPNSIDFVLNLTKASKLSYIGFSQGSAQAFAALSMQPELNDKLDVFIALAPIMRPTGYYLSYFDKALKKDPNVLFRIFGRKAWFPSVAFWQSILPRFILHPSIDFALYLLFNNHSRNIPKTQKIAAYTHIYCSSSVKTVVHWAQIMRNSVFSMYEDGVAAGSRFPTQDIKTPVVLIYGDHDILFDIEPALEHLPKDTKCHVLEKYEHLDVLWGGNVHVDVIPKVLEALDSRSRI
ncbi:Alpha/Beta hydrolase protein [Crassisporium funariophilum]|nr:Alpha/Beta hydrolase protein [Crassisporium funariophilum]